MLQDVGDFSVAAEARSGAEVLAAIEPCVIDLVILSRCPTSTVSI